MVYQQGLVLDGGVGDEGAVGRDLVAGDIE